MDLTIIQQGRFTSDGNAKILEIRSDVDWMWVFNYTAATVPQAGEAAVFYWQRGMAANDAFIDARNAGATADLWGTALGIGATAGGFTLVDSSANPVGVSVAVTSTTNAAQPVVATGTTTGLVTGSVVRLIDITGACNISGFDFEIDTVVAGVSFRMRWALANAPGAGTTGFYRQIKFDPIFYPRRRFIVNITQAAQAVITTSVTHGYTVGQEIRIYVPAEFGMVEMDGLFGTIVAVDLTNNTFTVDIDSTAFTAFAFPLATACPFTWAQAVPFGENTGEALLQNVDILDDATINTAFIGMILDAGALAPAGQASDVIYWRAGKSFSVDNQ
jgi:hypothetical protein